MSLLVNNMANIYFQTKLSEIEWNKEYKYRNILLETNDLSYKRSKSSSKSNWKRWTSIIFISRNSYLFWFVIVFFLQDNSNVSTSVIKVCTKEVLHAFWKHSNLIIL